MQESYGTTDRINKVVYEFFLHKIDNIENIEGIKIESQIHTNFVTQRHEIKIYVNNYPKKLIMEVVFDRETVADSEKGTEIIFEIIQGFLESKLEDIINWAAGKKEEFISYITTEDLCYQQ